MAEIEKRECTKIKYSSEKVAVFEILKIQKKSKVNRVPIRTYLCPHCLAWHLTSEEDVEIVKLRKTIANQSFDIQKLNNKILQLKKLPEKQEEIINEFKKNKAERIAHISTLENRIRELKAEIKNLKERYKLSF